MIRNIAIGALIALALGACKAQDIQTFCNADAVGQPIAAGAVAGVAPLTGAAAAPIETGVAVDTTVLHPAVQAACAAAEKAQTPAKP